MKVTKVSYLKISNFSILKKDDVVYIEHNFSGNSRKAVADVIRTTKTLIIVRERIENRPDLPTTKYHRSDGSDVRTESGRFAQFSWSNIIGKVIKVVVEEVKL
jgi:hypothetical protein